MVKRIFLSATCILLAFLALFFSFLCLVLGLNGASWESSYTYGNDYYTDTQNGIAQTANNIYFLAKMLQTCIKTISVLGFFFISCVCFVVGIFQILCIVEEKIILQKSRNAKELKSLENLKKGGYITSEEFSETKKRVLGEFVDEEL